MSNKVEVGAETSGVDGVDRLITAIDRLEASLAKLGGNNNAMIRMANQMAAMNKTLKSGFEQMIDLQSSMEDRSRRMAEVAGARRLAQEEEKADRLVRAAAAASEKKLRQQVEFEQKQEGSANKFHYRQIELQDTLQVKQLDSYVKFWEKIVATQAAGENTQKAIQERRDVELHGMALKASADYVALWEKMLAERQSVQERRDVELHAARAREFADYAGWWDKTLAEQASKQAKQLEMERMQQYELAGIRAKSAADAAAGAERQRSLNTSFLTSPLSGQVSTAEKAAIYSGLGGNAAEKFGTAAATADIAALRAQHALLPAAVDGSAAAISAHNAVMNEGHALARGLAGSLGGLWLTYGSLVPLAAGAALAGSLKAVVEQGRQVEYQLKFVEALGGGQVSLDKLLGITDQTVVSVREAAEGMRALAQNGLSASESLKVLPSLLNLSVIGEMSVAQAALAVTGAVSAFGLKLQDVDHVANVFAQAAATSNTSVIAMTESMKQGSTVASIYGASIEQAAAVMGVLAKNNIIGGAAGTAYTNMLSGLFAPTEKAKKALAELGVTTDDGNGHLKDQTVLLDEINRALNRYNDTARTTFMADIWTVRGTKSADAVLKNLDDYKKRVQEAQDVTNYMGQAVSVLEDSTTGSFKRLANSVSSSVDRAFASSSPALQALVNNMAHAAKDPGVVATLTNMADAVLRLTTFIYDHTTAIGVGAAAYVGLRVAVAVLPSVLTDASVAVGVFGLSVKTALGPIGWLLAAIGAAVTAYELFIDKTTDVEKSDKRIQNSIGNTIEYLDREITALKERNRLRDDPGGAKTIVGGVTEAEASLHGKRAQLAQLDAQIAAPVAAGGPAASERLQAERRAASPAYLQLLSQVTQAEKDLEEVRSKGHTLQLGRMEEETSKRRASLLASMEDIVKMGATHHKGDEGKLNPAFLGNANEVLYAKTQEMAQIKALYEKGQITENEAIAKRNSIRDAASAMLEARAPKEDKKAVNDALNADLKRLDLGLQLQRLESQANISTAKQQNRRGELGDLELINVELAEKLALDQKGVEVARQQYLLTADAKNKVAKGQDYTNRSELAKAQAVVDTQAAAEARLSVLDRMAMEEQKLDAKTMADKGEYVKAFLSEYEATYGTTIKKVTASLASNEGTIYEEGLSRYLSYLSKVKQAGADGARGKELKESFAEALSDIELRLTTLANSSGPGAGLSAIFDNALRSEQEFAASLPDLVKKQSEMQALAEHTKDPKDQKTATDELQRIETMGAKVRGIWVTVGKDIEKSLTDAFGKAGNALGGLLGRSLEYAVKQKQIDDDLAKHAVGADPGKLADLQKKAAKDSASAQISAYGDMAGAAKGFFNEQSGGYKLLATAEKAFRIAELVMTSESMVAKLFATTAVTTAKVTASTIEAGAAAATVPVVVGAEAAKSSAYGMTALAASLALPFPANLGAFAVVAGMLAAIGVAVAGSGGAGGPPLSDERQKATGTGTVFGDPSAKSDSIAKTLALVEKNTFQDLAISDSMLTALRNIEAGIGGLGALVTRQVGQGTAFGDMKSSSPLMGSTGALGAAGAAAGAYLGSAFGPIGTAAGALIGAALGVLSRVKTAVTDQGLNLKSQSLGDTLRNGASGTSYVDVNTKKSFLGVTYSNSNDRNSTSLPAETLQQFTLVIAQLRGGVIAAADALGVGGDAFIAKLDAINVGITNLSTKGLTGEEIQKQLEAAFSSIGDTLASQTLGGMEKFAKVGEGYLETVMRVAAGYQTVDVVFQSFGKVFGQIGLESIAARQRLIDLAGGIDQFNSQGAFFLKNFFSSGEQATALKSRIDPTLQKYGLSTAGADATETFKNFVVALDTTTAAGAQTYQELMSIAPAFKAVIDGMRDANAKAKDLQDQIDELTMTKAQLLAKARALDIAGMEASTVAIYDRLAALKAVHDSAASLLDAVDAAFAALQRGIDREKAVKTAAHDLEMKALQERIDTETTAIAKHKALSDAIKSTLEQMHAPGTEAASRADAQAQIRAALAIARTGGPLPEADSLRAPLSVLTKDSTSLYSTMQDYLRDFYSTQNDIASLGSLADDSLSIEQKTLDVLTAQKEASQLAFDNEVKRLDGIVDAARVEVEFLKGADTSLLTIADLLRQLNATMMAARVNPIVGATASINTAYQTALGRAPEAAGLKFWQDQAAGGLSTEAVVSSISNSPEAKIQAMYRSTLGRSADPGGMQFWMNALQSGVSLDAIQGAFLQSPEYKHQHGIPGFANGGDHFGGLRMVGEIGPEVEATGAARIHSTQGLMDALRNPASSNDALLAELRQQRLDNQRLNERLEANLYVIAKHAQTIADLQEKQDAIGTPPVRTT